MFAYSLLETVNLQCEDYQLVPIRKEDIFLIKQWRNEQMDILRQKRTLSDEDQTRYFDQIIFPSFKEQKPLQILLSYLFNGQCIGYGGIVHINWEDMRGEISFLLETSRSKNRELHCKEFQIYLNLIKSLAFDFFDFHRLTTEVFDIRPWHIEVIEKSGFIQEGRLHQHVKLNDHYVDSLLHACLNPNHKN